MVRLTRDKVRNIGHLGGTVIGTHQPGNQFRSHPHARWIGGERTVQTEILAFLPKRGSMPCVGGGDGSLTDCATPCTRRVARWWGVPKTIDNDLDKTMTTFGFDTAVAFATEVHR